MESVIVLSPVYILTNNKSKFEELINIDFKFIEVGSDKKGLKNYRSVPIDIKVFQEFIYEKSKNTTIKKYELGYELVKLLYSWDSEVKYASNINSNSFYESVGSIKDVFKESNKSQGNKDLTLYTPKSVIRSEYESNTLRELVYTDWKSWSFKEKRVASASFSRALSRLESRKYIISHHRDGIRICVKLQPD